MDSGVLLPQEPLVLSVEEVRQLWSFVHGDIMDGAMRRGLRESLGLCPRHAWGHAVVEIELWHAGAGRRGGHQPFDVAILHEDLLQHAAEEIVRPLSWRHRDLARVPVSTRPCRICQELGGHQPVGPRMGYANSNSQALTVEANSLEFTVPWFRQTRDLWLPVACPACTGSGEADPVLLCRRHLLDHGGIPRETGQAIAARLLEIRARLLRLIESMTDRGEPATAKQDASWVEALGWFAGWALPVYLSGETSTG